MIWGSLHCSACHVCVCVTFKMLLSLRMLQRRNRDRHEIKQHVPLLVALSGSAYRKHGPEHNAAILKAHFSVVMAVIVICLRH